MDNEKKQVTYNSSTVSYTHLDVYKRQELTVSASAEEKQYDKETIRDRKEQPIR